MTYALREAREYAAWPLPAQTARRTALHALIPLESHGPSFHDPFHAASTRSATLPVNPASVVGSERVLHLRRLSAYPSSMSLLAATWTGVVQGTPSLYHVFVHNASNRPVYNLGVTVQYCSGTESGTYRYQSEP
jgi:hypothetical protein